MRFLKASAPSSVEGIEKYLGSGMIRGIGPVYATRMVRLFGTDVFDIIEASPARLREVVGIGPKRADRITAAWADQKRIREIMVFLHQHGVGTARAVRIFKTCRRPPAWRPRPFTGCWRSIPRPSACNQESRRVSTRNGLDSSNSGTVARFTATSGEATRQSWRSVA